MPVAPGPPSTATAAKPPPQLVVPAACTLFLVPAAKAALPGRFPLPVEAGLWDDPAAGELAVRVHVVATNQTIAVKIRRPAAVGVGVAPLPGDTVGHLRRKVFKAAGVPVSSQSLWLNNAHPLTDMTAAAAPLADETQTVYVYTLRNVAAGAADASSSSSSGGLVSAARRNFCMERLNVLESQHPFGVAT